jgi:hypothetical protein
LPQELDRIAIERLGNGDKFWDVDLTLIALDHSDERLGTPRPPCHTPLGEIFAFSRGGKDRCYGSIRGTA